VVCGECSGSRACDVCDGYGDSTCGIECTACGGSGVCPGCFGDGETRGPVPSVEMEMTA
jgi:hypothetical protein